MPIASMTVADHALTFARMAREACMRYGAAGEAAVLKGVRRYGEQRGRRMAAVARAHGYANDLVGFLLFGELDFATTGNVTSFVQETPYAIAVTSRCGWCDAWRAAGLLDYGRLYCLEIDAAVMRGYNPSFRFAVDGTMSNGAPECRFLYYDGCLGPEEHERLRRGREALGAANVKPFAFHTAELRDVMLAALRGWSASRC